MVRKNKNDTPWEGHMKRMLATACLTFAAIATTALAGTVVPADVAYEEGAVSASLTGVPGDAANGKLVMGTKSLGNCIACHETTDLKDVPFHGEVGPVLDGAGSRWNEAELRGIVTNAKMTFEDSMMPSFYKNSGYIRPGDGYTGEAATGELLPILSAQEVEDVVAYLQTLTD
jgi:sulfur-oxidizing protein SoxX